MLDIRQQLTGHERTVQAAVDRLGTWTAAGQFYVPGAYEFFRQKAVKKAWATEVWRSYITPEHYFILWLGAHSKLLTKDMLP